MRCHPPDWILAFLLPLLPFLRLVPLSQSQRSTRTQKLALLSCAFVFQAGGRLLRTKEASISTTFFHPRQSLLSLSLSLSLSRASLL